jgi:hypothetical protein
MAESAAIALLILAAVFFIFGMGVFAGVSLGYEKRNRELLDKELAVIDACLEAWNQEGR